MTLRQLVPDAKDLLALEPEEIGGARREHLQPIVSVTSFSARGEPDVRQLEPDK